ncbi:MAG: response regulator [Anaerolineales bacterium]|uniref:hybrid sensor histidine kinase/response regulator n=1 Tax=Candidatus Villigracilis proximus TaxID=3140683 RepID=UPI003135B3D5|nr:response regulator [Anaerolineales bacterium]
MEDKTMILVIDDEPAIRMGLAATLARRGYSVVTAMNGDDGYIKAKQAQPDLIISDVMMPALDGFEMKQQMSEDPQLALVPFIFLTARAASEDRVSGIRNGADDYVTKPFVTEELIARIEAVLRRVKTEQERGRIQVIQSAQEEMDKLRKEVLQNFSHELRTPLGNVMMSLDMVVNHKFTTPEEQGEFIRIAHSSADRLESLIADIILLADIDQNKLNTLRQTIDPENHILAPIKRRLARYETKRLSFVHDISLDVEIKAPRREFAQALVHLLDNAFRFSPERGRVALLVSAGKNGGASITVQDEGRGIPVELREKVFERFYQVSQGDGREYQGLGLGLTIARAMFSSLGGEVRILDTETGCCVQAILPDLRPEDITYG